MMAGGALGVTCFSDRGFPQKAYPCALVSTPAAPWLVPFTPGPLALADDREQAGGKGGESASLATWAGLSAVQSVCCLWPVSSYLGRGQCAAPQGGTGKAIVFSVHSSIMIAPSLPGIFCNCEELWRCPQAPQALAGPR